MAEFSSIHQVSRNVLVIIGCVLLWGPLYTYIIFNDIDVCPKCLAGNSLAFATYVLIGLLAICTSGQCCALYPTNYAQYRVNYFMPIDIVIALFTVSMGAGYVDVLYDSDTHYKCSVGSIVSWATLIIITIWVHARKYYMREPVQTGTYALNATYAPAPSTPSTSSNMSPYGSSVELV